MAAEAREEHAGSPAPRPASLVALSPVMRLQLVQRGRKELADEHHELVQAQAVNA